MTDTRVTKRFAIVGIIVPAALTLVALALQLSWLGDTPNPLAVHWGPSGADGSGPRWILPLITLVLGLGLPAWLWGTALPRLRRGSRGWSFRFLAATAIAMSVLGSVAMTWAVFIQRGLESWTDAPDITVAMLVSLGLALGAGFLGWFVQPAQTVTFDELPTTAVELGEGERAVWLGVAKSGPALVMAIVLGIVLVLAGAAAAWVAAEFALMWVFAGLAVLLTVIALTMLEADVRVDANGIEVRGPAGLPRVGVALEDITSASAINVEALGSFGGFGWRRVPGAFGVVLRSGPGIRVERAKGPALVVTVDDAVTAVALLEALKAKG